MTTDREPLRRVVGHRLSAPTSADFHAALRVAEGAVDGEALWADLTGRVGVPAGTHLLTVPEMEQLAAALAGEPGALGLAGRALAVRVAAYRALCGADAPAPPVDWSRRTMEMLLRGRVPDVDRLDRIAALDLFGPAARAAADRTAARAADRLGVPIGLVSIVLDGSQEFAGSHGLGGWLAEAGGTPVEWSFCATMVRTREPYVVPDTRGDVVQRANPLVTRDGIGSYAGAPLLTSDGHVLGSCCVLGDEARTFGDADLATLQEMADSLVADLERRAGGRVPGGPAGP